MSRGKGNQYIGWLYARPASGVGDNRAFDVERSLNMAKLPPPPPPPKYKGAYSEGKTSATLLDEAMRLIQLAKERLPASTRRKRK